MELWAAVIKTPDYEQTITVEMPDDSSEDIVRTYLSKYYTVFEIWKEEDED